MFVLWNIFSFSATNDGELTIYAGEELIIVEEDDGSGWLRVIRGDEEGYIPASYSEKLWKWEDAHIL